MQYFLYFILFVVIIVLLIVKSIFNKTEKEGVPYKVGKKFINKFNPKIDEEVNFWYNERTQTIYIYLKGTGGGQGNIGTSQSIPDAKKLQNDELFAKIHNITEDTIYLKYFTK
jgi:hypothetical protein